MIGFSSIPLHTPPTHPPPKKVADKGELLGQYSKTWNMMLLSSFTNMDSAAGWF